MKKFCILRLSVTTIGCFLFSVTSMLAQVPVVSYYKPLVHARNPAITILTPTKTGDTFPGSTVSAFAGNINSGYLNGIDTTTKFSSPNYLAVDASENMYVADPGNQRIREITSAGIVPTFSGSRTWGDINRNSESIKTI